MSDGTPQNCVRSSLEQAGFVSCAHLQLADLGMAKGQAQPTPEAIARVAEAGPAKLACSIGREP